jgi:hypothetical protein
VPFEQHVLRTPESEMNALYYAMRYRATGGTLPDRDLAHEHDMRRLAREQLLLDVEEEPVPYEPTPLDEYEF